MKLSKQLPGLIFASLFFLTSINAMAESTDALYVQDYRDVLDRYYTLLINDNADGSGEGEMGVWEAKLYPLQATALDSVGYALEDISGDGVPELLIGAVARWDNQIAYGSEIFAMYTCVNGEPTLTFEGWARNRYCTMREGTFFYQGSGGAAFSLFGTYTLAPDGTHLTCDNLYFTYEKSGNPEKVALYHNQTGSMEPAKSQELSIPEEQFWQMEAELESRVQEISLIPFSQYTPSLSVSDNNILVLADWIKDMPTKYDEYRASDDANAGVLFTAVNPVKDFRLLTIQLQDVEDKDGNAIFSTEDVHQQDMLTPECPLVAYLDFFGDIPNNGIAFVDEKGNTRYFAISISGEDGSLQLIEFWK